MEGPCFVIEYSRVPILHSPTKKETNKKRCDTLSDCGIRRRARRRRATR